MDSSMFLGRKLIIFDLVLLISVLMTLTLLEICGLKKKWSSVAAISEEYWTKEGFFERIDFFGAIRSENWLWNLLFWFLGFNGFVLFWLLLLIFTFFFSFNFFLFLLLSVLSLIFFVFKSLIVIGLWEVLQNVRGTRDLV